MFKFKDLPYPSNALEPVLSQKAVDVHYNKHHRKYYDNLEGLIKHTMFEDMPLVDIIRKTDSPVVFNNAAQIFNHDFFWQSLRPAGEDKQTPIDAIDHMGWSFDEFKEKFVSKGLKHFGSGWLWLVSETSGLEIWTTSDASTPITKEGTTPLLCIDLWEHSYYVDYMNDRKAYLEKVYELLNWEFAAKNLKS